MHHAYGLYNEITSYGINDVNLNMLCLSFYKSMEKILKILKDNHKLIKYNKSILKYDIISTS
jgi:hypothetical protein